MCIHTYVNAETLQIYSWLGTHTYITQLCLLSGPKSSDIPVVMSKPSVPIFISIYHFYIKIKQASWRMAASKTAVRKIPEISILQRQRVRKCSKNERMGTHRGDMGAELKNFPTAKLEQFEQPNKYQYWCITQNTKEIYMSPYLYK